MMQEGGSQLSNRKPNSDVPPQIEAADTTDEKIDQGSPQFIKKLVETIKPINEIIDERNLIDDKEELPIKSRNQYWQPPTFDVVFTGEKTKFLITTFLPEEGKGFHMSIYDMQEHKYTLKDQILSTIDAWMYSRTSDMWLQNSESVYYFIIKSSDDTPSVKIDLMKYDMLSKENEVLLSQEFIP